MKNYILLWVGYLYWIPSLYAQISPGARLAGMGNYHSAVQDTWAVEANPAGLGHITQPVFQLSYQHYFLAKALRRQALAFVLPFNKTRMGFHLHSYGIPEYQDLKVGWVLARTFGSAFTIGVRAAFHQLHIPGYGTNIAISADVGIFYEPGPKMSIGIYADNPADKTLPVQGNYLLPCKLHAGMAYHFNDKVLMAGTLTFTSRAKPQYATGIDYRLSELFSMRAGINIAPASHHFGFGLKKASFTLDAALIRPSFSGYSSVIAVGYAF